MRKAFLLALSNIRKAKGQTVMLTLLILVAALLFNIGLVVSVDYGKNFDDRAKLTNTEDVIYSVQSRDEQLVRSISSAVRADSRTAAVETTPTLCNEVTYNYADGEMTTHCVIMPVDTQKTYGQFLFAERTSAPTPDTVYLPYLFQKGGHYKIGDRFLFKINGVPFDYRVGGFYENTLMGSFNGGICSLLLEPEAYAQMESETNIAGTLFSVKVKAGVDLNEAETAYGRIFTAALTDTVYISTNYRMVKQARTVTASIGAAILCGMSFLIVIISLIVAAFRVANSIEEDMKISGTLKAMGYTSGQIIGAMLLQFMMLAAVGTLAGIALSYAALPVMGNLLVVQTGVVWRPGFEALLSLTVAAVMLVTVALTVLAASAKIKRISPITALRQGVETHSFKRNPVPLEKSRGNVNLVLAMKAMCRNVKQNVSVFVIVTFVTFIMLFSGVLYQNFVIDHSDFLMVAAGETADAAVYTPSSTAAEVKERLGGMEEVERVYRFGSKPVYADSTSFSLNITDNAADLNNQKCCYDGRMPLHDNEVALGGKGAQDLGKKLGDTISLTAGDTTAEYLICGFIQTTNYLGYDAIMLSSGYARMDSSPQEGTFYITLKKGFGIEAFIDKVNAQLSGKITATINVSKNIEAAFGVYTSIVAAIVAVLCLVVLGIIALVLYLMVKTMIIRKRSELGIQKALGYTSGQLVLQTALSFLPVVFVGVLVGLLAGGLGVNSLCTLLFASIGIMECNFALPPLLFLLIGVVIVGFAFGISALVSLRIRKLTPRALIAGE